MGKSALKYAIAAIVLVLVAYKSVYFKKLDEVKAERSVKTFDAAKYAENFWTKKLIPGLHNAVSLDTLIPMLSSNPAQTFDKYSHALGIGNLRYFLVQCRGNVKAVDEDDITLSITGLPDQKIKIATLFIFGNAVRDASGMVNINDFNNTMDFNNVSAGINNIIRAKVLPLVKQLKVGDEVAFTCAIELNKAHLNLSPIEAIPVAVQTIH